MKAIERKARDAAIKEAEKLEMLLLKNDFERVFDVYEETKEKLSKKK